MHKAEWPDVECKLRVELEQYHEYTFIIYFLDF